MMNVGDTSAIVGWSGAENSVKYRIRHKKIGETIWINTYQNSTLPLQRKINGLAKNTSYEVQVLTDCGYSDYSAFSSSIIFTTAGDNQRYEGIANGELSAGNLSIFPNPNSGIFQFTLSVKTDENYHLEILNIAGAKIWEEELIPVSGKISNRVSLEQNLPKGIYFLKVNREEEEYSARILLTQ